MVTLAPDEHILLTNQAKYHGTRGTLYLTNMKLEFEYEKRGIIFKGKYSAVNLPLQRVAEVSIIGIGPFKKLSINLVKDQSSYGIPRYEFNVENPETWKAKVEIAKSVTTEKIPKEKEVIVKEIVKIRCRYCGMLVEATLSKCPNCGSLLT